MLGFLQFALLHYIYYNSLQFAILVIPNASWLSKVWDRSGWLGPAPFNL